MAGRRPYPSERRPQSGAHGELGDREGGDEQPDGGGAGAELRGVIRQEGHDHGEPHHVHERRDEEDE